MTSAASLRADQRREMAASGDGLPMVLALPSATSVYDPASGNLVPGSDTPSLAGIGRISRFSDTIASGELIDNTDSLIVLVPDEAAAAVMRPANDAMITVTLEDGVPQQFRVISWTPRYLAGGIVNYRIQGRR